MAWINTAKDDLQDTATTLLTAHTPSGAGATGGAWVAGVGSGYVAPVAVTGGFRQTDVAGTSTGYLDGSSATGLLFVEAVLNFPNDTGYAGVALVSGASGAAGQNYYFGRNAGAWDFGQDGTSTSFGTPATAFSTGVDYTLRLEREVSGSDAIVTVYIDGVQVGQYTDTSSAYVGAMYIGMFGALPSATWKSIRGGYEAPALSYTADNAGFVYYGRWKSGTTAITINNGSECRFCYTGNSCTLQFDVTNWLENRPTIAYWVDNVGPTRAALSASGLVTITPTHNSVTAGRHHVRFQANIESGYPVAVDNWADQSEAVRFLGVTLAAAATLLDTPTNPNTVEFLGDSITAGLRVLYTGGGDTPAVNAPEINWPEMVADMLGLMPIVNGHGGQSLAGSATDGTPAANAAFPYIYSGEAWAPTNPPVAVVIYHGTNAEGSQAQWEAFLTTIRTAYPRAVILAINPYGVTNYTEISAAVTALSDNRMFALDYGSAFDSTDRVSDSIHFNVSGSNKMAAKVAKDLQDRLNTLTIKTQSQLTSGGYGGNFVSL